MFPVGSWCRRCQWASSAWPNTRLKLSRLFLARIVKTANFSNFELSDGFDFNALYIPSTYSYRDIETYRYGLRLEFCGLWRTPYQRCRCRFIYGDYHKYLVVGFGPYSTGIAPCSSLPRTTRSPTASLDWLQLSISPLFPQTNISPLSSRKYRLTPPTPGVTQDIFHSPKPSEEAPGSQLQRTGKPHNIARDRALFPSLDSRY